MRFPQGKRVKLWLAAGACSVLWACSPTYQNHGYVPTDAELENIVVGRDTRETVEEVIGQPSSTGVLDESGWYYISSRVEHQTYKQPLIVERQLLAISFNKNGTVANIERFGLEDGKVIALSRRVTDSGIKGPGFFAQILGNLGNFVPSEFIEEE